MKHIQLKYNFLHIFFWLAVCALGGFAAIFLTSKGLSNTQIGTATGGACMLSIVLSPMISSMAARWNRISLQQILGFFSVLTTLIYLALAYVDLPAGLIIVLYMFIMSVNTSVVPLLSSISMEYIAKGENVNFGLSRGLGSISYAAAAVVLSFIASKIHPSALSVVYLISNALFIFFLFVTPAVYASQEENKGGSYLAIARKYKRFMWILFGFALVFACATALSTYLIRIIEIHGGSESLYGFAIFCMAASEMPVMAIAPKLMKKHGVFKLIAASAFFYILRNVLIAMSPNLGVLLLGMMLQGFSYGLLTAVITYYVSMYLGSSDQVQGQTMIAMMTSGAGSMLGNLAGGSIIDAFGLPVLFGLCAIISVIGGLIMIFSVLPEIRIKKVRKPLQQPAIG